MSKVNIKPLADRVLVEPAAAEEKTASGLYIPDTAKEKPQKGVVIAVGNGKKDEPLTVKVGDTVQYSPSTIDITGNLSYAQKYRVIDVNSSTNEAFTKSQIDGAAVGLRFK